MTASEARIQEKLHRLPATAYVGEKTVAFTVAVKNRYPLFNDAAVVGACVEILGQEAAKYRCEIPIFCFMPDHLHLLVRGREPESNIKAVVDKFKLRVGFWLRTRGYAAKLQANYYDHIIRGSEDWVAQAAYVALNPVRAGLVENPFDFAGTGCVGMDREEMLQEIFFGSPDF